MQGRFVAYYRVSTQKQGASGLGLEAQQAAVMAYLNGGAWELIAEFTEVETGKGANPLDKRPELRAALALCKKHGATLVIAKLDRLARNVHFVSGLLETGCDFVAADMPQANKVMIQMHAVMSEWERDQISKRTKDALAAAKVRGVKLGAAGPMNLRPNVEARQKAADAFARSLSNVLAGFKAAGLSQRSMVAELNALGVKTARGGQWSQVQLQRVLVRTARP
ncbi:recombinase family protein [Paraburkholderia hospita]|uniref:recombinase family protein n=1 Tax=Paraburkholderia hospita TaxID=169430 RepID=UPI000271BFE0|nr:recombinase family protein [Paraburkholderia hospita]EUC21469.1 Resolvase domain-containing protein [Burkholderia sp. BT03]SKC95327.1 Site-specific DNA recombinase [Paraburkholderia hospita]